MPSPLRRRSEFQTFLLVVSRTGIPENFTSFRPHFQIFLILFDQIPSFCHNFRGLQIDFTKVIWIPTLWPRDFDTILQSGFPGKFCNKLWHPLNRGTQLTKIRSENVSRTFCLGFENVFIIRSKNVKTWGFSYVLRTYF